VTLPSGGNLECRQVARQRAGIRAAVEAAAGPRHIAGERLDRHACALLLVGSLGLRARDRLRAEDQRHERAAHGRHDRGGDQQLEEGKNPVIRRIRRTAKDTKDTKERASWRNLADGGDLDDVRSARGAAGGRLHADHDREQIDAPGNARNRPSPRVPRAGIVNGVGKSVDASVERAARRSTQRAARRRES
jgi:hypothetical protein